ncbi:MAG: hypothetical protein IJR46_05345 [Neisseriaceae bacterium]|nr:hypothetical protein [Neisseriaceae bacterium]
MKSLMIGFIVMIGIIWVYLHMPLSIRRHKDIKHGNTLIERVQTYQKQHQKLPESNDLKTLEQLGFIKNKQGWQPAYQKQNENSFQIIYQDGYVAPYLYWQSDEKNWALREQ